MTHRIDQDDLERVNIVELKETQDGFEAVPRACQTCGEDACYGIGRLWLCTGCRITMGRIACQTSA